MWPASTCCSQFLHAALLPSLAKFLPGTYWANSAASALDCSPSAFPSVPSLHDSVCSLCLQGTILPGVTRKSVLELAEDLGFTAEEAPITIEEAMQADEVFTTGTAVVLSPVGSLTYKGSKKVFGKPGTGGEQHVWEGSLGCEYHTMMHCRQI